MKRWVFAAMAFFGLAASAARADCAAGLGVPQALRSAAIVADYRSSFKLCKGEGGERVALREMRLQGEPALMLADPQTLQTQLERAACWTCADAEESALASTRLMRAIRRADEPPPLSRRGVFDNAGLRHGAGGGGYFTGDLCPSNKPMDRGFLAKLEGTATPIALSISGLWLTHHFKDYRWLLDAQTQGRLAITWIDHSYSHPYRKGFAESANFLLLPGVDPDREILETERLLIANGQTPSLFFRFPGLVSSSPLMQAVKRHHLISLGADAWLALNQRPHDGSIVLVHPNGNEALGLKIYTHDAATGALPSPLKPLDDAPE